MRTLPGLLVLLVVVFACNRGQEQREAIRQLSSDWDQAYIGVYELIEEIESEQLNWRQEYQRIVLSEEELAELDEPARSQLENLKKECQGHGESFDALGEELEAFSINFDTQTTQLEELEMLIEEEREVEDLKEKIQYFETILQSLPSRLNSWKQRLDRTRQECRRSSGLYIRLANHGAES